MTIRAEQLLALMGDPGPQSAGRYMTALERRVLLAVAQHVRPYRLMKVLEFGVNTGETARLILDRCKPAFYVGIDLPEGARPALALQAGEAPALGARAAVGDLVERDNFNVIAADSRTLRPMDVGAADMVIIDGGHDYETVLSDTRLAEQVVADRGVIVWHDYNDVPGVGVRRVIDDRNAMGDTRVLVEGTWLVVQFCGRT